MASIVQWNKSFSVIYTIYDGEKKRQKQIIIKFLFRELEAIS